MERKKVRKKEAARDPEVVRQRQREPLMQRQRCLETWMRRRVEARDLEGRVWGLLGG